MLFYASVRWFKAFLHWSVVYGLNFKLIVGVRMGWTLSQLWKHNTRQPANKSGRISEGWWEHVQIKPSFSYFVHFLCSFCFSLISGKTLRAFMLHYLQQILKLNVSSHAEGTKQLVVLSFLKLKHNSFQIRLCWGADASPAVPRQHLSFLPVMSFISLGELAKQIPS